jgi:hypothetical protein
LEWFVLEESFRDRTITSVICEDKRGGKLVPLGQYFRR